LVAFEDKEKSILLYANELYLTNISDLAVTVKQAYFKGHNYLIKAVFENKALFFENPFAIPENERVCLTADEEAIKIRLFFSI
jgi:hypothetical protein